MCKILLDDSNYINNSPNKVWNPAGAANNYTMEGKESLEPGNYYHIYNHAVGKPTIKTACRN